MLELLLSVVSCTALALIEAGVVFLALAALLIGTPAPIRFPPRGP